MRGACSKKRRFTIESLEDRAMCGSLWEPTNDEQLFLELLNAARANPAAYGQSIGLNLSSVAASQPLAFNLDLIEAARKHSQDMNTRNFFAHTNPSGEDPGNRIDAAGYAWTGYGESLAAGFATPAAALAALIIDDGVPDLGHRKHLLSMDAISATLPEVGIGIVFNGSGQYEDYYTIDTARTFNPHDGLPDNYSLTGVVYSDLDLNDFYTPGEGYGGVTVGAVVSGGGAEFSTTTFASGGYSLELPAGSYDVSVFGGSFPGTINTTVTMTSASNRKMDFLPSGPDGGPDPWGNSASSELAVWTGTWHIDGNANDTWDGATGGDLAYSFGKSKTDVPAAMDWNGDGTLELGVLRKGKTLMIDSNGDHKSDKRDFKLNIGNGGDQAVLGDWDGDGDGDIGVLRNEDGMFHLDTNGDRMLDAQDARFAFGTYLPGDIAVVGDWNGDGIDDVGYFRGSTFTVDSDGDRALNLANDQQVSAAIASARPAPADYNGDGTTDLAVFAVDTFHMDADNNGSFETTRTYRSGVQPVAGNWV